MSSYQKHHAPSNEKIPEEKEVSEDIQIFKAQNGILSNKIAPVIRKVSETTIKLTPLDIPINDYLADIFEDKEDPNSQRQLEQSASENLINAKEDENEYNDQFPGNFISNSYARFST